MISFKDYLNEDLDEAIKGWKHAHSDIAKMRAAAASAGNDVKLVRLKKDGKESGMHDATKTFKSEEEARAHHENMVKLNPGRGIAHNLYVGGEHKEVLKEEVELDEGKLTNTVAAGAIAAGIAIGGANVASHHHAINKLEKAHATLVQKNPTKAAELRAHIDAAKEARKKTTTKLDTDTASYIKHMKAAKKLAEEFELDEENWMPDYSKHSTEHLQKLLEPGTLHKSESKYKMFIRRELKKRNLKQSNEEFELDEVAKPKGVVDKNVGKPAKESKSGFKVGQRVAHYRGMGKTLHGDVTNPDTVSGGSKGAMVKFEHGTEFVPHKDLKDASQYWKDADEKMRARRMKEEVELDEANFADTMKKAIAAHERGDHARAKYHLDNAKTARYAMKSTEISKHKDLLDKYKELRDMHEEFELSESYVGRETKDGVWRVFKTGNPVAVAGPFKSSADASAWIRSHSVSEEVEQIEEVSTSLAGKILATRQKKLEKMRDEKGSIAATKTPEYKKELSKAQKTGAIISKRRTAEIHKKVASMSKDDWDKLNKGYEKDAEETRKKGQSND